MYDDVHFFKKQNSISMVTMKFTVRTRILHRYSVYDNDQVGGFDFDLRYDFTSHPSESLLMCTLIRVIFWNLKYVECLMFTSASDCIFYLKIFLTIVI